MYANTEIGIAVRREYDHATRALDENEINIIERALNEVEWKSANARDLGKYDKKLWDFGVFALERPRSVCCAQALARSRERKLRSNVSDRKSRA